MRKKQQQQATPAGATVAFKSSRFNKAISGIAATRVDYVANITTLSLVGHLIKISFT